VTEITGVVEGVDPNKCLKVLLQDDQGGWHQSTFPVAITLLDKLDKALKHIGKSVKLKVENGQVETIGFE
jgi:hypothetical protein